MKIISFAISLASFITISFFAAFSLAGISSAQQAIVSFSCDQCYVNNCQCTTDCNSGKMNIFTSSDCHGSTRDVVDIKNGDATFFPIQPGQYFVRIDCNDNGQTSLCQLIYVSSYPGQTLSGQTTTTTNSQPTQVTTTTTTTTIATQTQTTIITTRSSTNDIDNQNGNAQSSSSLNFILTVAVGIGVGVIAVVVIIFLLSKRPAQDQFQNLKQKWGR